MQGTAGKPGQAGPPVRLLDVVYFHISSSNNNNNNNNNFIYVSCYLAYLSVYLL